jgi:hypothetical protein
MFKRTEGGFIFRAPGCVPHHYLVSEAQKADILKAMRPSMGPKGLLIGVSAALAIGAGCVAIEALWTWANGYEKLDQWIGVVFLWLFLRIWIVASGRKFYDRIGTILLGARPTQLRVTWRDRHETNARLLPISFLLSAAIACGLIFLWTENQVFDLGYLPTFPMNAPTRFMAWVSLVGYGIGATWFFYLAALKLMRKRGFTF